MNPIDLWELLPSTYQIDDAARGYPLKALLNIISQQANVVQDNIADLWDDFFIETCADWVIPYIGDLIGNIPIYPVLRGTRADVARTIYFRRRKGTLPMLEELARYVTGWSVHTVAFFDSMTWTQNMNHLRDQGIEIQLANVQPVPPVIPPLSPEIHSRPTVGTVDLRDIDALDRIQTGFDTFSHSADVRPMTRTEGWHNIANIGFFIWRLGSYRLENVTARRSAAHPYGYHFSPLGNPAPIFNAAERETDESGVAAEIHIDSPIRPTAFYYHKTDYYPPSGAAAVPDGISIFADNARIEADKIECMNLRNWDRPHKPGIRVGVDVERGRLTFSAEAGNEPVRPESVRVYFSYGFSADIGGGSYRREHLQVRRLELPERIDVGADSINIALGTWNETDHPAVEIEIGDSRTFGEDVTLDKPGLALTLQARDRQRPLIIGTVTIGKDAPEQVTLDGLVIEGHIEVARDSRVKQLTLKHCTLVPGQALDEDGLPLHADQPSLLVRDDNEALEITLDHCITGWLQIPAAVNTLTVRDSIIDSAGTRPALAGNVNGQQPAPRTTLERVTIFGEVFLTELTMASEVIFTAPVISQRRQTGCVRFSYVPEDSETPRRYHCQPDSALEGVVKKPERQRILDRLTPVFTARHYGEPAYAQLGLITAPEIREGGENRAEMGVFNTLMQPQRAANLRTRLDEYLPFGLEAGFIYVT
jgi:hypothetical protein